MVASRNDLFYDGAQSSEDSSGLHSPSGHDQDRDFRLAPRDLDIRTVPNLLIPYSQVPTYTNQPFYSYPEDDDYCPGNFGLRPAAPPPFDPPRPPLSLPTLLPPAVQDHRVYLSPPAEQARSEPPQSDTDSRQATVPPPPRREASLNVIACKPCRARKIRCDSTRPACNNCIRRSNDCQYDLVPKRRGPDKRPGTRQRSCKKRPADGSLPPKKKQKKSQDSPQHQQEVTKAVAKESLALRLNMNFVRNDDPMSNSVFSSTPADDLGNNPFQFPPTSESPSTTMSLHAPIPRVPTSPDTTLVKISTQRTPFALFDSSITLSDHEIDRKVYRAFDTPTVRMDDRMFIPPSVHMHRKDWFDNLLDDYSSSREESMSDIVNDLTSLFSSSAYWISFINEKLLLESLWDQTKRRQLQPSLIYAGLALATLMKSSELGHGHSGRERALWLRDAAQSSLDAAWNTQSVDSGLAEAAMILALFESSAHPAHSAERACSALLALDQIIKTLALTRMDHDDPNVTTFPAGAPPVVPRPPQKHDITTQKRCFCEATPIVSIHNIHPNSPAYQLSHPCSSLEWDKNWSVSEIQQEEKRRLCWSALTLAAAHTAHCAAFGREPLELFLIQPENYAILFPGEKLEASDRDSLRSPKQSVWALYCRSMLLWNGCLRLRKGSVSDSDKAEFALQAWLETQEIQDSIESHVCGVDHHLLYMTREYICNTRIAITYEFRRFVPLPNIDGSPMYNRRQAEDWLFYQNHTVKTFQSDLRNPQSQVLAKRPFYVWWFMSQVAISLSLWGYDHSLTQALDLCKAFLVPLDILSALWPCKAQRDRYMELREEVTENCRKARLPLPSPPDFSIPANMRLGTLPH